MSEPSLLAEPIATPRGMILSADGQDPYETYAAYVYGLEVEQAKRYFNPERYTEIWVFVDSILEAWEVPPKQLFHLIRTHPSYQVADAPAWFSATALVCIEKSRALLGTKTDSSMLAGRQAALWMQTANLFSGIALSVISGAEDAFVEKVFRIRQRKISRQQRPVKSGTAMSVTVAIMTGCREKGMTLRGFIEAAMTGSVPGLKIEMEDGLYDINSDDITSGSDTVPFKTLERWWAKAGKLKKVTPANPAK